MVHSLVKEISMASKSLGTSSLGFSNVILELSGQTYPSTSLRVLKYLCFGLILGQDFQKQHTSLIYQYGGHKAELIIAGTNSMCALSEASMNKPSLFPYLLQGCKPITAKSQHFIKDDHLFIQQQTYLLLS